MATGDKPDITSRLGSVLPRWFGDLTQATLTNAVLQAFATTQSFAYSLIMYAALQLRIKTASDGWLDMIAADFFGPSFTRRAGQSDASFRSAIISNLLRERATRASLIKVLQDVTGRTPVVIELTNPVDCGAYRYRSGYGYTRYGSIRAPFNLLVKVYRPTSGLPQYGISDADIYAAIESVRPTNTLVWAALFN
jgi:hypothetical protein